MRSVTCPFCDPTQAYRYIDENENMIAMYAKSPACKYHVLIVSKRHVKTVDMLSQGEAIDQFSLIRKIVDVAANKLPNFTGYNILSNNGGPEVNQRVEHCHVHVFLRTKLEKEDPLKVAHKPKAIELTKKELDNLRYLQQIMS